MPPLVRPLLGDFLDCGCYAWLTDDGLEAGTQGYSHVYTVSVDPGTDTVVDIEITQEMTVSGEEPDDHRKTMLKVRTKTPRVRVAVLRQEMSSLIGRDARQNGRSRVSYLAIGCLGLFAACNGPAPTAPTPIRPSVTLTLDGVVNDTAYRPVSGANVKIVDGMPADLSATTDESGRFSLTGTFTAGKTTIRASKEGYATTSSIFPPNSPPRATIRLSLPLLIPPVIRPGDYTMTFVADSTCDLPEEARTRTYSATITSFPVQPETLLGVTLKDASFLIRNDLSPTSSSFTARVAGDYIVFDLDPEFGYAITERLAPATYLELMGSVAGSIGASGVSPVPFDGTFYYCVKQSDTGSSPWTCGRLDLTRASCTSKNHRVILRRR